jgi:Rieske Fe-S protein
MLTRRQFVALAAATGGATLAGCGGGEAACAVASDGPGSGYCLIREIKLRVPGGGRLAVGQVMLFSDDDDNAVIVARDAGGLYALSAVCTHSCCMVTVCDGSCSAGLFTNPGHCAGSPMGGLAQTGTAFICACHGSEFAADGSVVTGPASSPLPSLTVTRDADDVIVDLARPIERTARLA